MLCCATKVVQEREEMEMENVKTCKGCAYFDACGDSTRTEKCIGRKEKEPMKKVTVFIEEHLCKAVTIEVPSNVKNVMDYAEQKARQMYDDEEIVLTSDDANGVRLMMIQDGECETNWFGF